ncbi:MAG: cation-translocating P-type ATPase [Cyanobacteria bacterium J06650_10]
MTTVRQWHTLSPNDALQALNSDSEQGLEQTEVALRLAKYGSNELIESGGRHRLQILLDQFADVMLIMLIVVAIIAAILDVRAGDFPKDAIAIMAIVILNAVLGYLQESRAEAALAALKNLSAPEVNVLRSTQGRSQRQQISAKLLVPGDILLLEAGDQIAADGRLLEAATLQVRESALTGEAIAVGKQAEITLTEDIALAERKNLAFQGTEIVHGRGKMLVTRTGMETELGKIATMIQSVSVLATPLQQRLKQLGNTLVIGSLTLVSMVVVGGTIVLGWPAFEELLTVSLSMAVAVVPEGLPAVITVTLALGTQRMVQRQALVRRLPAVETLGSVTTICSDKTGTLTQNKMVVQSVHVPSLLFEKDILVSGEGYAPVGSFRLPRKKNKDEKTVEPLTVEPLANPTLALLLLNCALCNDAALQTEETTPGSREWSIVGDPTEGALVTLAAKAGLEKAKLDYEFPRIEEFPFSSERKRMSVVVRVPRTNRLGMEAEAMVLAKGSAELLLARCQRIDRQARPLDSNSRKEILDKVDRLASGGKRVLGFAYRPVENQDIAKIKDKKLTEQDAEENLVWLGLVAMMDAARPEVREAVKCCKQAGIRPVMITGDHPLTASALALDLGMIESGAVDVNHSSGVSTGTHSSGVSTGVLTDAVFTGQQIEEMTQSELTSVVTSASVYARVSPEHKLRIVQALQAQQQVVAMTGDGVNDAPALKQADIGIAMGITGTDVSKEASDMVLLDDNFASIVAAAEEGRVVYSNIRKFVKYILGSNIGEVITIALSPLLLPIVAVPLTPLQILWMNLVTDGFPALALALEPPEPNMMNRPPHDPKESIFARGLGAYMLRVGVVFAVLAIALMLWAYHYTHTVAGNPDRWKTMVFTMLCLSQMGHAISVRSRDCLAIEMSPLGNPYVLLAVVATSVLQLLLIYVPGLRSFFGTHSLSLVELGVCVGFSSLLFVWLELEKLTRRR